MMHKLGLIFISAVGVVAYSPVVNGSNAPYHIRNPGFIDHTVFSTVDRRRRAQTLLHNADVAVASQSRFDDRSSSTRRILPTAYGADASGVRDSSDAFALAVKDLLSMGVGTTDLGAVDLGGTILDLDGGAYSISQSIVIPSGYSNFRVQGGSLIASMNFSTVPGEFMLQIGGTGACNHSSGGSSNKDCNADVGVQQMSFEAKDRAYGALLISDTMDANVGPAIMVTGFTSIGISLAGTGAGYIHEVWLGQFQAGDPTPRSSATATCILLDQQQHDCDVNNVIIFSGKIGINSTNGANRFQGVHTWNDAGAQGGTGILLHTGTGRVSQCYLDYAPLVVRRKWGGAGPIMIEGSFFLGTATIVLEAQANWTVVDGLMVTNNVFTTNNNGNKTFYLDESGGSFGELTNSVVENNVFGPSENSSNILSTKATMTKPYTVSTNGTEVKMDFTPYLVFPPTIGIYPFATVCNIQGYAAGAIATEAIGNVLTVRIDGATNSGNVTCTVSQSKRTLPAH